MFDLSQRLDERGTTALCEALESSRDEVMTLELAAERFEHRLTVECSNLRFEIQQLRSELRSEHQAHHAELLKWAFVFWAGQAATIGGLMTVLN